MRAQLHPDSNAPGAFSRAAARPASPAAWVMNRVLAERRALGLPTFNMNQGLVNAGPLKRIADARVAASESAELWKMGPVEGLLSLREEIAKWRSRCFKTPITADNVMITCGANNAHMLVMTLLSDPGDLVVVPRPYFFNHANLIRQSGRALVSPPLSFDRSAGRVRARLSPRRLELLGADRARYLLVSNPHNPSGARFDEANLTALASWAEARGTVLVVDESYCGSEALHGAVPPWAEPDSTIVIGSLSKSVCLGDLRLGYIITSERAIAGLIRLQDSVVICPSMYAQEIAQQVIACRDELLGAVWRELKLRSELLDWRLAQSGITGVFGDQAVFKWLETPRGIGDEQFVLDLAEQTGVISTPGSSYGCEGFFRISYGMLENVTETADAAGRICEFFRHFS